MAQILLPSKDVHSFYSAAAMAIRLNITNTSKPLRLHRDGRAWLDEFCWSISRFRSPTF